MSALKINTEEVKKQLLNTIHLLLDAHSYYKLGDEYKIQANSLRKLYDKL